VAELHSKAEDINRLREECKTSQSKCTELQQQYNQEVSNVLAWKKEAERLEAKITSMKVTYESSTTARVEQETRIGSMISQLRTLVENAGVQCTKLQTAHSECTKVDLTSTHKISVEVESETRVKEREVQVDQVSLARVQSNVSKFVHHFIHGGFLVSVGQC
jgi:outer membrane murein-binding lipoprotein Lpp